VNVLNSLVTIKEKEMSDKKMTYKEVLDETAIEAPKYFKGSNELREGSTAKFANLSNGGSPDGGSVSKELARIITTQF